MPIASWVRRKVASLDAALGRGPAHHPAWAELVQALQTAGIARELALASLPARLDEAAQEFPEPSGLTEVLDGYYRGDGDVDAGLRRVREDRYVCVRERGGATARQVVARLRLACPEIGPLGLVDDDQDRLVLRTSGAQVPFPFDAVEEHSLRVDDTLYVRRNVTVRALVHATNLLLAARDIPHRFLPLDVDEETEIYVALEAADALVLEAVGLFDTPLGALRAFAGWDRGPMVSFDGRERRVA